MRITKKKLWAPITIELESADELKNLVDILCYTSTSMGVTYTGHLFSRALMDKLEEMEEEI